MAVEARRLNLFPSQLIGNREMMSVIEGNNANNTFSNAPPIGYGVPQSGTIESLLPMYSSAITDLAPMKAESGLTYNNNPVSRKRSRDSIINPLISFRNGQDLIINDHNSNYNRCGSYYTFLGEDISFQIQQQQLEIDRFISQHTEKVRLEIEERRKRDSRRIMATVEEGIMKKLRSKEEEIEKIGRLNWALEEKVKSLCVENQIWRDLAQNNEATANILRSNLEQVMAQVNDERHRSGAGLEEAAALMDDAQSCCGSNCDDEEEDGGRILVGNGGEREKVVKDKSKSNEENRSSSRWCKNCGKHESCVLLLPCRHLCLCTVCGSSVHACPICNSINNATVHINLSS